MILDGVDVGLVTLEVLDVVASAHVPNERHLVASLLSFVTKINHFQVFKYEISSLNVFSLTIKK